MICNISRTNFKFLKIERLSHFNYFNFDKSLFPGQIQPFVAILANTIFNILVRLKICKAQPKRYNVASSTFGSSSTQSSNQSHITITIPLVTQNNSTTDNSDAERRRSKALKALKERLKKPGDDEEQLIAVAEWSSDAPAGSISSPPPSSLPPTQSAAEANSSTIDETKLPK